MDNVSSNDTYTRFSRKNLSGNEVARVFGVMSSIFLVKSIGGEVYNPKKDNSNMQRDMGRQSPDNYSDLPHMLDLEFVEEIDNWDSWFSKTSPSNQKRPKADFKNTGVSNYVPVNHRASPIASKSEDGTFMWEMLTCSPQVSIDGFGSIWPVDYAQSKQYTTLEPIYMTSVEYYSAGSANTSFHSAKEYHSVKPSGKSALDIEGRLESDEDRETASVACSE